ncbi:nitrilase-related carbon-nitrogen hydrolase [Rhodocytophaga aerolata]|uniref:Nitrilase-related carbon-nitrogen hydrolase n=2 Tax=Rhodocytophaga aerolata TaxID=455078 RepID=A0ABT8R390_9BACT|nr:nitrilase-related carbon-nitrogen hydrolase [Rhodocytophaga aerolata]
MKEHLSRRRFIQYSSLGAATLGTGLTHPNPSAEPAEIQRLPREVWIGTVSLTGLSAADSQGMVEKALHVMQALVPFKPDIICLPESFAFTNIQQPFSVPKVAEKIPGPIATPFLNFAKTHRCYVICPTYSLHKGSIYIAAVLIDRTGNVVGEYHKCRPTDGEIASGVRPGSLDPPLFETDFGKIGIQICFDIKWEEGWQSLKEKGAEIIFWPSAYGGGREVNSRAWRHQVYVVSSTQKGTAKICDVTGDVLAQTGSWQPNWTCGSVNLEKAFILTWPAVSYFGKIQQTYGRKIKLTTFDEEEWTILESLDAGVNVADVLKEFNLQPQHQVLKTVAAIQSKSR